MGPAVLEAEQAGAVHLGRVVVGHAHGAHEPTLHKRVTGSEGRREVVLRVGLACTTGAGAGAGARGASREPGASPSDGHVGNQ